MRSTKLVIKTSTSKKDGTTPIYIQYSYNREKRTLLNTQKRIAPKFWNAERGEVRRSHPKAQELNQHIKMLLSRVDSLIDDAVSQRIDPSIDHIKLIYNRKVVFGENEGQMLLVDEFQKFMEDAKRRVGVNTIGKYDTTFKHLQAFEKHNHCRLGFEDINYSFYLDYTEYLAYVYYYRGKRGLSTNSIAKDITNIKTFLRHSFKTGVIPFFDISYMKVITEEVDSIYLNEDEINAIECLELKPGSIRDTCRDLLLIGCETGLRHSDFSSLQPANIQGNMLRVRTHKNHALVVIPISNRLRRIFNKYDNKPPQDTRRSSFNHLVKKIGKLAKIDNEVVVVRKNGNQRVEQKFLKYQLMSSHVGRRSFCTNQFNRGVPTLLIRKISGHKTEASFLRYIKVNQEAAAKKMLELWQQ